MPGAHECFVVNGIWFVQNNDEVQQRWQEFQAGS
jgi:hypothetical protein